MDNDPQYRTQDGSALRIWKDTAQNKFLSEREGRPVFDEVIFVEVISPGSRDSTPVFEVKRTFAKEAGIAQPKLGLKYADFKQYIEDFEKSEEHDASLAGTPLSQWPEMSRTLVATLKAQNVFTVEAVASLPDTKLTIVGPDGRTWREKAKAFIENAKGSAHATALAAENERLRTELADQAQRTAELAAKVDELLAAQSGKKAPKVEQSAAPVADPANII